MELQRERLVDDERLRGDGVSGDLFRAGRKFPAVVVELEPRTVADQRLVVTPDVGPPDFAFRSRCNGPAHRTGNQLTTETDSQDGLAARDRFANKFEFRREPVADASVIPGTPRRTERNDEVVVIERGENKFDVGVAEALFGHHENLFDFIAVVTQPLGHGTRRAHVVMLNEECLHSVLLCMSRLHALRCDYKHLFFDSRDYYFV
ncbi:unannotated protein [freshwater metagenome]|uniref:Unannotated protein n=1 Tax=freshwater metagenome TaxID=449393 RepID=A0A6J7DQ92_9ZZZZ